MTVRNENLGGITVFCNKIHKFGTDAVLLADFAAQKKAKYACDMGCGCGIISLLLLRDNPDLKATAVDIQSDAIELVKKAIDKNNLENNLKPVLCDLKKLDNSYFGQYDLVTMNPPYKRAGAGLMSDNEGVNIARFELLCTFEEIATCASKLLKPSGRFCVCHRPERLTDIFCDMRNNNIEPKRLRLVCQRSDSEPMLVLVEGIKQANEGLKIMPNLVMEDEDSKPTKEVTRIYTPWLIENEKKID